MPLNNNLKPVELPMDLKFGQVPVTNFINNDKKINPFKVMFCLYMSINDGRDNDKL